MSTVERPSTERVEELKESLADIRSRVKAVSLTTSKPTLVAVSKYKPASDILACFEDEQLDFGENYVQELEDKAAVLPGEIRWHFIGTLQSNKAKVLAAIPNLYSIQTLASIKTATALNKAFPSDRSTPLRVLLQVNTSGEDSKSGLPPLSSSNVEEFELTQLATHIVKECPKLRLEGLMTIGALELSLTASETEKNADFERLKETRDALHAHLVKQFGESNAGKWGHETTGKLLLSMGMSSDFDAALKSGSDIVRVGTGIFGQRVKKTTA
ncbi:proline synthetase associated protein [Crucibulum laeve]|uniref:Pyridoxal phosphate homeostasis protein n=1 Tax=Crucibulum laeve TaxID=68775 RepID=A0A5C3LXT8_9AGAR|nr:proline synthetase associated protein [Crucibulum laeve]